jgi:hypothetical protein
MRQSAPNMLDPEQNSQIEWREAPSATRAGLIEKAVRGFMDKASRVLAELHRDHAEKRGNNDVAVDPS